MPANTGNNLEIYYGWLQGEDGWGEFMNDNLLKLDSLTQLSVISKSLNKPPLNPDNGNCYIIGPNPIDDWENYYDYVTVYHNNDWKFYKPKEGWVASIQNDGLYRYDGFEWVIINTQLTWKVINEDVEAKNNIGYACDVRHNILTVTLPKNPITGYKVGIRDLHYNAENNPIIIDPNGNNIEGASSDVHIDRHGGYLELVFVEPTRGWIVFSYLSIRHGGIVHPYNIVMSEDDPPLTVENGTIWMKYET